MNEEEFARGLALYESGAPFEAHEHWERCWHAAKERRDEADERLLRGLIHLCAARIKVRQQNAIGLRSHLESAAALLQGLSPARGLDVPALSAAVAALLRADQAAIEGLALPRDP